jgi:hypothetical protein
VGSISIHLNPSSVNISESLSVKLEPEFGHFIIFICIRISGRHLEQGLKPPPQVRHVEITVVLHVLRGMEELKNKAKEAGEANFQIIDLTKDDSEKHKVMICNYRFFRDFTEGCKDPTWIINMVNHFLPADLNQRFQ